MIPPDFGENRRIPHTPAVGGVAADGRSVGGDFRKRFPGVASGSLELTILTPG